MASWAITRTTTLVHVGDICNLGYFCETAIW
jgi:hypothetical protein